MAKLANTNQFYKFLLFSAILITCFAGCNKETNGIEPCKNNYTGIYIGSTHEIYYSDWGGAYPTRIHLDTTYLDTCYVFCKGFDSLMFKFLDSEFKFRTDPSNKYSKFYGNLYSSTNFYLFRTDSLIIRDQSGNGGGGGRTIREKNFKAAKQ